MRGVELPADARGQRYPRGMISRENRHPRGGHEPHPAHSKSPPDPATGGTNDEDKHGAALTPGDTEV